MEPTPELAEVLFRDRVLRARAMSPEERIREGFRLFEVECEAIREGIRRQHPDWDEEQVSKELRRRLDIRRRLDYEGISVPLIISMSTDDVYETDRPPSRT